jgi:hypothetical protein
MHIEIVSAIATQPNTGLAATALTGDSLTVKNANRSKKVQIIAAWSTRQVAGFMQLIFPSGHDTTRGFRCGLPIGAGSLTLPLGEQIEVQPQETLADTIAGSNVAADIEQDSFLIHYEDMPGIDARLISYTELTRRGEKRTTIESSVAAVATGQYSEELINADSDLLLANRDYAVVGMQSRTAAHNLTLRGPDLGNVRIGCPGNLRPELTNQWFSLMSKAHGIAAIPVINSGNKGSTFVGFSADENAAATLVTLQLVLLK